MSATCPPFCAPAWQMYWSCQVCLCQPKPYETQSRWARVFIHEVGLESKHSGSRKREQKKKKRVNDACYSEKTNPWWTETESTFELLPSGGQTVQACPHCEDSLPYISTTSGSQRQSAEYLWRRICQIDLSLYLGLVWFVSPRAVVIPRKRRSRVIICKAADFRNWI